jgi:hypothetical protein
MTAADRERLAGLEREVAELRAALKRVAVQAATLMTLEEITLGYRRDLSPAAPPRRPRHLQLVDGGAR